MAGRSEIPCSKQFHCAWWHPSRYENCPIFLGEKGTHEIEPRNAFLSAGVKTRCFVPKQGHDLTPEFIVSLEELMQTPRLQQHLAEAH
jgi:hypothetical protein